MAQSFSSLPSDLKHLSSTVQYSDTQYLCSAFPDMLWAPFACWFIYGKYVQNFVFSHKYKVKRAKVLRAKNYALGL